MNTPIHLFQAVGVELEHAIVDTSTLRVRPIADQLLKAAAALPGAVGDEEDSPGWPGSVTLGEVTWSNELALHVIEFKTSDPARSFDGLADAFARHVAKANELLAPMGCMLMPTGMHPTMLPDRDFQVWPHGYSEVYEAFNRIFDCRGHGWSNLQSAHLNLPFHGDAADTDEFGRLHAALRVLLPVLPALAASSPVREGSPTGLMDTRLEVYRTNSARIPPATGRVIPEPVYTRGAYEERIFTPIYDAYAPHDPGGVLRHEWANSRGCIARFTRGTIEVRTLDVQECPAADLAICAGVSGVTRAIVEGRLGDLGELRAWGVDPLHAILLDHIRDADKAVIANTRYLSALGWRGGPTTSAEFWHHLIELATPDLIAAPARVTLKAILDRGCLARRITRALGPAPGEGKIHEVYAELAACLGQNRLFGV